MLPIPCLGLITYIVLFSCSNHIAHDISILVALKNLVPCQLNIPTCYENAHFQNTPLKSHKLMNKRILLP
jgi:hypothetical protein